MKRSLAIGSCRGLTAVGLTALGLTGCSPEVIVGGLGGASSGTGSTGTGSTNTTPADKVDLLLAIDNSASMADKQKLLAAAIPDIVNRLINPSCVDGNGVPTVQQPTSSAGTCPSGATREFAPVVDMNIGIVDSSLGGLGSDACPDADTSRNNNDMGHLVARGSSTTYQNKGFVAWDANNTRGGLTDFSALDSSLQDLVTATGQVGCGYEQQLESVYRFLVDPNPYAQLDIGVGGIPPITPSGIDQTLLSQRAQFLRPGSLVAVVMLTDENDCSINVLGPQNYAILDSAPFFRASSICATEPNNPCCYSCGLGPPTGCNADAACGNAKLSYAEDGVNLKCWNHKRRYGFESLFPVKRYVNAFSQTHIDPTQADLHVANGDASAIANPLFADRDPGLVFFMGIVGVPYQALAKDPSNLSQGLKDTTELSQSGFFTQYVGDPDSNMNPTQPIMVEDFNNRGLGADAPNHGDRSIDTSAPNDLQYACVFDLPQSAPQGVDCQNGAEANNPLCTAGAEPQIRAKAYPSLRELKVVEGLGQQGIATSICTQNSSDTTQFNYGYRPNVDALIERMKTRLKK